MKSLKFSVTALLFFFVLFGCQDEQNITPDTIAPDAAPTLSKAEMTKARTIVRETKFYETNEDGVRTESEKRLYLGGKMEEGVAYYIPKEMEGALVEANPEWAEIMAASSPDLETAKARARAADSLQLKKKLSEPKSELASGYCYAFGSCMADMGYGSMNSVVPSPDGFHMHHYAFYFPGGETGSWGKSRRGITMFSDVMLATQCCVMELHAYISDHRYGCFKTYTNYCMSHWC